MKKIAVIFLSCLMLFSAACQADNKQNTTDGSSSGASSQNGENVTSDLITMNEAFKAALSHAGYSDTDVRFDKTELKNDNGIAKYEVEFFADNAEYEYDIDAFDGKIIGISIDYEADSSKAAALSADDALKAALNDAGLSESDVTVVKKERDFDNGVQKFEIEFYTNDKDYDYDIAADSGKVLSSDNNIESFRLKDLKNNTADVISAHEAFEIALSDVSVSENDSKDVSVELDMFNSNLKYEIEFSVGASEYEYEIDAVNKNIIKSEKD